MVSEGESVGGGNWEEGEDGSLGRCEVIQAMEEWKLAELTSTEVCLYRFLSEVEVVKKALTELEGCLLPH